MWFLFIYINFSIAQYSSQSHHQPQNHYKSPHLYHLLYQTLAKKTAILRHCKSQKSLKNYKKIFLLFQGTWLWRRTLNKYLSLLAQHLTLFRMGDKMPPSSFSPATSTNVGINLPNLSDQIIELKPRTVLKIIGFSRQILIKLRL